MTFCFGSMEKFHYLKPSKTSFSAQLAKPQKMYSDTLIKMFEVQLRTFPKDKLYGFLDQIGPA